MHALLTVVALVAVTTLAAVNGLDRAAFVTLLGGVFEHAPWVADRAYARRPFASVAALHDAMMGVVRTAAPGERLAFLNGHPELAGAEARKRGMTGDSTAEQGSAGLDRLTAAEFDRFDALNAAYREKFGFPFIIAVRGRGKAEILAAFEVRLAQDPQVESEAALAEIAAITRMRLDRLVAP